MVLKAWSAKTIEKTMVFNDFESRIEKHCVFIWFFGPEIRISPDQRKFNCLYKEFNLEMNEKNRLQFIRILEIPIIGPEN